MNWMQPVSLLRTILRLLSAIWAALSGMLMAASVVADARCRALHR
jgi:hypothetical protein